MTSGSSVKALIMRSRCSIDMLPFNTTHFTPTCAGCNPLCSSSGNDAASGGCTRKPDGSTKSPNIQIFAACLRETEVQDVQHARELGEDDRLGARVARLHPRQFLPHRLHLRMLTLVLQRLSRRLTSLNTLSWCLTAWCNDVCLPKTGGVQSVRVQTLVLLWNLVMSMRLRMLSFFDARPRSRGAACNRCSRQYTGSSFGTQASSRTHELEWAMSYDSSSYRA